MGRHAQEDTTHGIGGGRRVWMTYGRVWKLIDTGQGIRMASLNIRTGRAGILDTALWELQKGDVYLVFLQKTNLAQDIHTQNGVGYDVWETEAESQHRGGVAVLWRAAKGWQVEITASFGPNVVSFLLMLGSRRFYVVGAYDTPNDMPAVHSVDQVL